MLSLSLVGRSVTAINGYYPGGWDGMLRSVVRIGLDYRHLVLVVSLAILAIGGFTIRNARVDVLPEFDAPTVEVQAEALGLSAVEVENLVTINLEEILTAAPYLQSISSRSVPGLASVLLTFEPGTDLMLARQMVQERLTMAWALPNVSKPPTMLQPGSAARRAMIVGLSSDEVSLIDMSVLARWTMTPKLLSVPGVANVSIWGQRARQLQVRVDTRRLQANGVTLQQVIESTGDSLWISPLSFLESSILSTGGWIDTPNQRLGIQHVQPISRASDLAKIALNDSSLLLGDVATVVEGHPPLIGDAVINDGPGILLVIEKFPNAGANDVIAGLESALSELRQGMPGITVDSAIYQATRYIDSATSGLARALTIGAALMTVAVFLSYIALRPAILAVAAITLSFATAFLVLYVRDTTINVMHIVGLVAALSAVVDAALIAIEAIVRRRAQNPGRTLAATVFDAMGEIRQPVLFATLIGVLIVVPVFRIEGSAKAFFSPLAETYLIALVAAMIVTFVFLPGLALVLLRGRGGPAAVAPSSGRLPDGYGRVLSRFAAAPTPAFGIAAAGALLVVASFFAFQWAPVPDFKERDVVIAWEAAPGTSHPSIVRLMTRMSSELRAIDGVRSVAGHIGRAITGDQVVGIESGQLWVGIDDHADYDTTMVAIRETARSFPGIEGTVQSYLASNAQRAVPLPGDPIVVRIEGAEPGVLDEQAQNVAKVLAEIPGVANVRIDERVTEPEIQVMVDVAAAARFGLKPGDIRRATATVFGGLEVGNLFEDQKVFDVVVWGDAASRQSITDIEELLIDGPNGSRVRLGDVSEVNFVPSPRSIDRNGVTRNLDIRADVEGRGIVDVAEDVKAELRKIPFSFEYHAYLLSDYASSKAASWNLMLMFAAAAALVFFLLQAAVQSWRLALALSLALLAALSGGVLVILATGATIAIGSLAGLVAVLGSAVRGCLVTVNRTALAGGETQASSDAALAVAGERFWPLASRAIIIAVALAPAALAGGGAGFEIIQPLALVVIGGLVSAVLVNLFVVPALLCHLAIKPQLQFPGEERHVFA